jgi:hypothetical protein
MNIWDKVSQGIDKAAKVTESAIDEGKLRLQAHQARKSADQAAAVLGYASARAHVDGAPLDAGTLQRLVDATVAADRVAVELEARVAATRPNAAPGTRGGAV